MGLFSKILSTVDKITGAEGAGKAAQNAAEVQSRAADNAINFQKESRDLARSDLEPFRKAGESALPSLQSLVNDPTAQRDFVMENPFFQAITDRTTQKLLANRATKGRINAGDTKELLNTNLLMLGNDLVNRAITQKSNLASLGSNAASGQATITQNTGNQISDLFTQKGNVQASGIMAGPLAAMQSRQGVMEGGMKLAAAFAACDRKLKKNIRKVGKLNNGLPLYSFKYKDDPYSRIYINVMAQDVEKVKPNAVHEVNGYKIVNMEEVCL